MPLGKTGSQNRSFAIRIGDGEIASHTTLRLSAPALLPAKFLLTSFEESLQAARWELRDHIIRDAGQSAGADVNDRSLGTGVWEGGGRRADV